MISKRYENLFQTDTLEKRAFASFAAHVTKLAAKGDTDGISRFVTEAFKNEDPVVLERLAKIAEVFVEEGSEDEKRAFSPLLGGLQQAMALQPVHALQEARKAELARHQAIKNSLAQIVQSNPELAADPEGLAKHFEVLTRFAPDVAADPTLSGNILGQLAKLGPGAMTHQLVAELQGIQREQDAARNERFRQVTEAIQPFTRVQG